MKAMLLAAGRGTRLAPLTDTTPKPMLPVAGKPLIHWQLEKLQAGGVTDCVINLHHLGHQIRDYVGDGQRFGLNVHYSEEPELLDTGGGIVNALSLLGTAPFWIFNGDVWTDFDFNDLPKAPPNDCPAHIVVTPTPDWRERGDFDYADGYIKRRGTHHVYCCIAVIDPTVFAGAPDGAFSLRDIYFDLINQGRLSAQLHIGTWHDIGTFAQYQALQAEQTNA